LIKTECRHFTCILTVAAKFQNITSPRRININRRRFSSSLLQYLQPLELLISELASALARNDCTTILRTMNCTIQRQGLRRLVLLPHSSIRQVYQNNNACGSSGSARYKSTVTTIAESGIVSLPNRSLIRVSGRDAPRFLQGLTTNNVDSSRTDGWYTGFLNATGRVVTDAFLWPLAPDAKGDWACLLDVDSSISERLRIYLRKHKLRSKVDIRQVEGAQVWTSWASEKPEDLPAYKTPEFEGDIMRSWGHLADPRLPGFSHRFITAVDTSIDMSGVPEAFINLPQVGLRQYNLRRYLNGVPEGPQEMFSEHYQAHPSNLDVLSAVDFRKGCYVGQELTIRTEHTGVVRKRILPVQIYNAGSPTPASLSYAPEGHDAHSILFETKIVATGGKREAGKWLVGDGNVGLAMCRLESMTDAKVSAEGGTYTDQSEFSLNAEGAENLRIKAFIPDWLRERLLKPRKPRS